MCNNCNISIEQAYHGILTMDNLVVKVTKISEISQIARSEIRLRNFLLANWKQLSKKAISKAKNKIERKTTEKELVDLILKELNNWPNIVKNIFETELNKTYRLGKLAAVKRAQGKNVRTGYGKNEIKQILKAEGDIDFIFNLKDERTIATLLSHQLFWIDEFVDESVSDLIATVVRETMVEAGYGSATAGEILGERLIEALGTLETPAGYTGSIEQYFESLAANTITVARTHGVLNGFADVGVTHYEITNPMDRRTCERCAWLAGKSFSMEHGIRQMEAVLAAQTKEAVKAAHPWLTFNEIQAISSSPGFISGSAGASDSAALAAAGVALPPFHFKCRCSIDISSESTHWAIAA